MAKTPQTPAHPRRRSRRPERARSHLGRIAGAALGVAATIGVGTGLNAPAPKTPPGRTCGGTERWNVKVANDPDAKLVDLNPVGAGSIAELNGKLPGPVDSGGRMDVEKKEYTVSGFLSFFKHEEDGDYHVVITDRPGDFIRDKKTPPNGRSMVVEFPDADCLSGKSGKGPATSLLGQSLAEARAAFEEHVKGLSGTKIAKPPHVTVTGVGFFDFDHGQTGRATPHPGTDGHGKVFELHPVTAISFDGEEETD
jgi:hypothetical protein